jgi:hypothetical protein
MEHGSITSIQNKKQSMLWKHPGWSPPKKFERVPSAGKMMASVFWNSQGIIMIDYADEL